MVKGWAVSLQTLAFHRATGLLLSVGSVVSAVTILGLLERDPVVVVRECGRDAFYRGEWKAVPLTGEAVTSFAEGFLRLWLTREGDKGSELPGGVLCMATEGLGKKLKNLAKKEAAERKGKPFTQYVGRVAVELMEGASVATFDRILSVGRVPVVSRERVRLDIVRGKRSPCNPLGLYVNGVKEL